MRRAPLLVIALFVAMAVAGCVSGGDRAGGDDETPGPGEVPGPGPAENPTIAWGDVASARIRPGASLGDYCTFNWIFTAPNGTVYIGTAGHCTDTLGERVAVGADDPEKDAVGTVVYDSDKTSGADELVDFALVRLDADQVADAHPQMLGYDGPTGVLTASEAAPGDLVGIHGHGMFFGSQDETRKREGILLAMDEQQYRADMPAVPGDSGSALIHVETGRALGIISRFNLDGVPPTTDIGPTMEFILAELAKAGFEVTLATP